MSPTRFVRVLVLAVVLGTAVLPTRRADASVTISQVISALKTAYSLYQKFHGGELTLEQATDQMLSAIESAKIEILSHIDEIAAAEAKACAKSTIIRFGDIERLSYDSRQALAADAVDCLAVIESLLDTVDDKSAIDQLGFALTALGPVTLMARAHADLPESYGVSDMIINGSWAVIARLHPPCSTSVLSGDSTGGTTEVIVRCTAYNRDRGYALSWLGDPDLDAKKTVAEDTATRNTSRAVAQQLLPSIPVPSAPPPTRFVIGRW